MTKLEWPELKHTYNKKAHRVQNMVKLLYLISVIYLLVRVYARFISAFNVVQNQSDRYRAQGVAPFDRAIVSLKRERIKKPIAKDRLSTGKSKQLLYIT